MFSPTLSDGIYAPPFSRDDVLPVVAAMERHSRHPLAAAILDAAAGTPLPEVEWIREEPGVGLHGHVGDMDVLITNRAHAAVRFAIPPAAALQAPPAKRL